jgi:predicted RNA-binding protein YlxR (DUF448 family)
MPGRRATPDLLTSYKPASDAPEQDAAGADEPETGPLRRCAVTRERMAKERMIRFVVAPDRRIVPDLAARLPGRGIWLSARGDVIETARVRGAFAKAARGQVTVPPDLLSFLRLAVSRRIGDTIGLARRAGQAVCGFAKAREWVDAGRVGLIVQASDGSVDERARFRSGRAAHLPVVAPLDAVALGGLFGRDHVVHVVVATGRLADTVLVEADRLAGLEGAFGANQGPQRMKVQADI